MLWARFGWNWPSGSLNLINVFCYFVIIFPWKRALNFIWITLNSLHPRMLCAKFVRHWSCGFLNVFLLFHNYLSLERVWPFIWINLNSFHPRSFVEIGLVVLEKKIFKFRKYILLFHNYLPLEKGCDPSFEQTWIPFTQGCFVPSLVEIGPVVLLN